MANKNIKILTTPFNLKKLIVVCSISITLIGCMSTSPKMGGSSGNVVSGGAAGSNAENDNAGLEKCTLPLGTLSVFEDTSLAWWHDYRRRYPKLGSTLPVVRLMIQQSNCFVVVERGKAMNAMNRERQLMQSGQLRQGSNLGGGQMVAADYTISPEIQFSAQGTQGLKAVGASLLGSFGSIIGGGLSKNEAATTLLLIDNRSGVQVSAAVGNAGNYDFSFFGGLFSGGFAGASGFSNSPEGKIITAAFADSYNQMVKALRNYKAQQVKGGLGKGGMLTVGGADDPTPQATASATIVEVQPEPTVVTHHTAVQTHNVVRDRQYDFEVDEYDEDAMKDYYDALKQASEVASGLATISSADSNSQHRQMALGAMNMFSSRLATSKIELESWPMGAKKQAWRVLGKKIKKYNKLFEMHRQNVLNSDSLTDSFANVLNSIELITEESLFNH
ncbi:CsgG/HfaB family protein [Thalassotalea sp. PP2-459]|uniref:CsgG/HfaB family protein n=1 Tax=Thalassotalea sp. PP2-459 TaxID=1742724 RepID=UPI000943EF7B|nr:CsgG/HfaB family protein [Thalassotalea sp. PP2-459]OKY27175.1 hypothetical protein BI291_09610 [Thalassotalea sp. PP2-459]